MPSLLPQALRGLAVAMSLEIYGALRQLTRSLPQMELEVAHFE